MQSHFLIPPNLRRQVLVSPDLQRYCSRIKFKSLQEREGHESGGPGHRFDQQGKLKELRQCTEPEMATIPSSVPPPGRRPPGDWLEKQEIEENKKQKKTRPRIA